MYVGVRGGKASPLFRLSPVRCIKGGYRSRARQSEPERRKEEDFLETTPIPRPEGERLCSERERGKEKYCCVFGTCNFMSLY